MANVLVIAGLDPSGGAGLCADIEVLSHWGIHSLPIITTLTVQNTQAVQAVQSVSTTLMKQQIHALIEDMQIDAIKIGLLSNCTQIDFLFELLTDYQHIPIVLDPIITASMSFPLLPPSATKRLKKILPLCTIITPNAAELDILAGTKDKQGTKSQGDRGDSKESDNVQSLGACWVLLTKTDSSTTTIHHKLYQGGKVVKTYTYPKLSGQFHGSGCTLSTTITAQLLYKNNVPTACWHALNYTYQTLIKADKLGKMQSHPNRLVQNHEFY